MKQTTTGRALVFFAVLLATLQRASGQEVQPAWNNVGYFEYKIERVDLDKTSSPWKVKVIFSVQNPNSPDSPWDIKLDAPFTAGRSSTLRVLLGWDTSDYTNTGSQGSLSPISAPMPPGGIAAAVPIQINLLTSAAGLCDATSCSGLSNIFRRYYVTKAITPLPFPLSQNITTGVAAMEGHPACVPSSLPGCPTPVTVTNPDGTTTTTYSAIPVQSQVKYFSLTADAPVERRKIVEIAKCQGCHTGQTHDGEVIPRLSLHGANRNENLGLCVICHNPNQTDIPYRASGAEVSIDFKRMVHSIHAGGMRETPFVVVGFQGSVNDFSDIRFPRSLRNCLNCHVGDATTGHGTYELPLAAAVLGSTVDTRSTQATSTTGRIVDVNPFNDLKITPTAAACSGCHDESEVRSHMIRMGGASFATTQDTIGTTVRERCVNCHGSGKERDVRKEHGLAR